jgi:cation diffusion facilitator CzcD-associated flavoprotein CzcO
MIDVAIIGAGPYGLSTASYLKSHGVAFRIFGSPMRFWLDMPKGTGLKSPDTASNIYTPLPNYRFVDYCKSHPVNVSSDEPIPMSTFAQYGLWAQQELVPEVEDVQVCRLEKAEGYFALSLDSGEVVKARRVVVAVGLSCLQYVPVELEKLGSRFVTHTFLHGNYAHLRGKDVTVLGSGQSALEAARMLLEQGAIPRIIARGNSIVFHGKPTSVRRSLVKRILKPDSVVGPGRLGWLLEHARTLVRYLPEKKRVRMTKTRYGPFGSWWLQDKIEGKVTQHLRTHLVAACESDGRVVLTVRDDNGERQFATDHVVSGTGYVYSVERIRFLSPSLCSSIDRVEAAPKLSINFESSAKGLYFIGPIAAYSFGPLMRFVCGAEFAAPTVARHVAKNRTR